MKHDLRKAVAVLLMLALLLPVATALAELADSTPGYDVYTDGSRVLLKFYDPALEDVIQKSVGSATAGVPLSQSDLSEITELDFSKVYAGRPIDLSIAEHMPNLKHFTGGENVFTGYESLLYCQNLVDFDTSDRELSDVGFLAGIPSLTMLTLTNCPVSDISVVAKLPKLQLLQLKRTQVSDISPVAECKTLEGMVLDGNEALSDITPLGKNTKLQLLHVFRMSVTNMDFLPKLKKLNTLELIGLPLAELPSLQKLSKLQMLRLSGVKVTALPKLPGSMQTIISRNTPLSDVAALKSCTKLSTLRIINADVTNLSSLRSTKLLDLHLWNCPITDVKFLSKLTGLLLLEFDGCPVESLKGIEKCKRLVQLNVIDSAVTDLAPLAKLNNLQVITVENSPVTVFPSFPKHKKLKHLNLSGCQITDLTPILELPALVVLDISRNPVADLRPLLDSPTIKQVTADPTGNWKDMIRDGYAFTLCLSEKNRGEWNEIAQELINTEKSVSLKFSDTTITPEEAALFLSAKWSSLSLDRVDDPPMSTFTQKQNVYFCNLSKLTLPDMEWIYDIIASRAARPDHLPITLTATQKYGDGSVEKVETKYAASLTLSNVTVTEDASAMLYIPDNWRVNYTRDVIGIDASELGPILHPIEYPVIPINTPAPTPEAPSDTGASVTISDPNIRKVICEKLGVVEDATLTDEDLARITDLWIYGGRDDMGENKPIDLNQLPALPNLNYLWLDTLSVLNFDSVQRYPALNHIELSRVENADLSCLTAVPQLRWLGIYCDDADLTPLTQLSQLELFTIQSLTDKPDPNIVAILKNNTRLYDVSIFLNTFTKDIVTAISELPGLTRLSLSEYKRSAKNVWKPLYKANQLEYLSIIGERVPAGLDLVTMLRSNPHLKTLEILASPINNKIIGAISDLSELEYLRLDDIKGVTRYPDWGKLPKLKELYYGDEHYDDPTTFPTKQ